MNSSPFQRLSGELRNEIYELAVTNTYPITINDCGGSAAYQPTITRVCRQMRQESLLLFYKHNRFVIVLDEARYNDHRLVFPGDSDDSFCDLMDLTLKWIRNTPVELHSAVAQLELRSTVFLGNWRTFLNERQEVWINLAEELERLGYGEDRLQVDVELTSLFLSVFKKKDTAHQRVQSAFSSFGLKCITWSGK